MNGTVLTASVCSYGALRRATRGIGQLYDRALLPVGINAAQYNVLSAIQRLDSPIQSELASDLVMDLSALGHTLKLLIRDGWILMGRDAEDGRKRRIAFTSDGEKKFGEAYLLWRSVQKKFELALDKDVSVELRKLLDHLASDAFVEAFEAPKSRT